MAYGQPSSLLDAMEFGAGIARNISERRRTRLSEMLNQTAGGLLSSGDYGGAASALLRGGDIENGLAIQQMGQQQAQLSAEQARAAAPIYLQGLQALAAMSPQERATQAPLMARDLQRFGIQIPQGVDLSRLSDEQIQGEIARLQPIFAAQAAEPIKLGAGDTLYQPGQNGQPGQPLYTAPRAPAEPAVIDAFVNGAKRPLVRGPDGSLMDQITGQPVDPSTVTFDTPRENSLDYNAERAFRAEFESDPRVSGYVEAQRAYESMQNLSADDTGASDVALVFSFFKTIDPSSTVREGEYAQAASAMGLPQQIITSLQGLQRGVKLDPVLRTNLVNVAGQYLEQHGQDVGAALDYYRGIAPEYRFAPDRVTYDPRTPRQGDPLDEIVTQQQGAQDTPRFATDAEAEAGIDALPPGTVFIGPDGQQYTKN